MAAGLIQSASRQVRAARRPPQPPGHGIHAGSAAAREPCEDALIRADLSLVIHAVEVARLGCAALFLAGLLTGVWKFAP
jgi:hypothetical protein